MTHCCLVARTQWVAEEVGSTPSWLAWARSIQAPLSLFEVSVLDWSEIAQIAHEATPPRQRILPPLVNYCCSAPKTHDRQLQVVRKTCPDSTSVNYVAPPPARVWDAIAHLIHWHFQITIGKGYNRQELINRDITVRNWDLTTQHLILSSLLNDFYISPIEILAAPYLTWMWVAWVNNSLHGGQIRICTRTIATRSHVQFFLFHVVCFCVDMFQVSHLAALCQFHVSKSSQLQRSTYIIQVVEINRFCDVLTCCTF